MTFSEIETKIREYLKINNRDCDDEAVKNYIYVSAYERLCADMYGTNPIEIMKKQNNSSNESQKQSMLRGGLNIKKND